MIKTILISVFISTLSLSGQNEKVYICKGGSAYAYHKSKTCKYLLQCTHTIVELTIAEAGSKYKRTPCKPCYK